MESYRKFTIDLIDQIKRGKKKPQIIDVKRADHGFPHMIYDMVSSFSNQDERGIILFGCDANRCSLKPKL